MLAHIKEKEREKRKREKSCSKGKNAKRKKSCEEQKCRKNMKEKKKDYEQLWLPSPQMSGCANCSMDDKVVRVAGETWTMWRWTMPLSGGASPRHAWESPRSDKATFGPTVGPDMQSLGKALEMVRRHLAQL